MADSIVRRINRELYKTIQEIARKNNVSVVQASKDAAVALKNLNGKKSIKEIRF